MVRLSYRNLGVALLLAWGCWPLTGLGAQWRLSPRLSMETLFIDNVRLSDSNPDSDYVQQVTPGLSFEGESRRLTARADYDLQNLNYFESTDLDKGYHNLNSFGSLELLADHLFLEATADYRQSLIDFTGPGLESNLGDNSNRTDTRVLSLAPYWQQQFGQTANGQIRFSVTDVAELVDSTAVAWQGMLTSGPRFQRLQWTLDYRTSTIYYDGAPDSSFRRGNLDLRYRLANHYSLVGGIGVENNDYVTDPNADDPRGVFWSLGLGWDPSERTHLDARIADRFFGRTYSLELTHQRRRLTLTANYSEEATSSAADRLENAQSDPGSLQNPLQSGRSDSFIEKRARVGAAWQGRRSRLSLDLSRYDRNAQSSLPGTNGDERTDELGIDFSRRLGRLTSLETELTQTRRKSGNGATQNREWYGRLQLKRQLGNHLSAALRYSRGERYARRGGREYRVNILGINLLMEL